MPQKVVVEEGNVVVSIVWKLLLVVIVLALCVGIESTIIFHLVTQGISG